MPENLTESQQKQFFDDGYIILKDFFSIFQLTQIAKTQKTKRPKKQFLIKIQN